MTERIRGDQYKGTLQIGQRVNSMLYSRGDGVIFRIENKQNPESCKVVSNIFHIGGRAVFHVVFFGGGQAVIPESIIRGVQWFIYDRIEDEQTIKEALDHAEKAMKEQERKEAERKAKLQEKRLSLPQQYPHLTANPAQADRKLAAKNMRVELKKEFPTVKFSITSERSTVNVRWIDGPTDKQVECIVGKYQIGHFNGMEDIYEYDRENVFPELFGGARYVFTNRDVSQGHIEKTAQELGFSVEFDGNGEICNHDLETLRVIMRAARENSGL